MAAIVPLPTRARTGSALQKSESTGVNLWSRVLIYNRLTRERERETEREGERELPLCFVNKVEYLKKT